MKNLYILILFLCTGSLLAQVEESKITSLNEGTLQEKFDFLKTSSNNFREFKVIKKTSFNNLQSQVEDSIKNYANHISQLDEKILSQETKIKNLENDIVALNEKVTEANNNIEAISYLGIDFSKSAFKTIMSFIILALLAGLVFMYFQFKNSNYITVKSEESLEKIQKDFEAFKKRALEREQVLKRELMDLRNNS